MQTTIRPARTLLWTAAAIVLVAAAIALPYARHYLQQQALIVDVKRLGGSVVMEPGEPHWLRGALPAGLTLCFDTPREVHLAGSTVNDAWLTVLRDYPSIKMLGLADTAITDAGLVHLAGLPNLQVLWLSNTRVSDAGLPSLRDVPQLTLFYLDGTRVTDTGVAALRKRLPQVDVQW